MSCDIFFMLDCLELLDFVDVRVSPWNDYYGFFPFPYRGAF